MTSTTILNPPGVGIVADADAPPDEPARRRWIRRPGPNLAVFGIYAVISLIADFPVWPGDPSRVPTMVGEDIFQTAWFLEWTPYALLHGKNLFETNALNYPVGVNLAQNTGIPLLGLVTAPLTLAVNPIASENLLRFFGFALSAYAAYWVLRKFTTWMPAAFVGGLLYGFSPYMLTQGSIHLNLMFVPFPPLILYGLFELFVTQASNPVRRGLLIGACAVAQYFISVEVLATTLIVAGIGTFFLFFSCIDGVRARLRNALIGLVVAVVVLAVFTAYPTWVMFFGPVHYSGPAQGFNSLYNADLLGSVVPTPFQLVTPPGSLGKIGATIVGGEVQENGSYIGIPLIAITVGIVVRMWRKLWPVLLAMLIATIWLLSLGPRLVVDGHVRHLPFDLPFRKIDHLPGIENILPIRFSLYVAFFIAILVAMALDSAWQTHLSRRAAPRRPTPRTRWLARGAIGVAVLAAAVSLLPAFPYRSFRIHINTSERAKALSIIPSGAVVVTYPYPTTFYDAPMLWQALDSMRFKLVGGYALVPNKNGRSSVFPSAVGPEVVESMLINSVSPVSVPGYPVAIATNVTVNARVVTVDRDGVTGPPITKGTYRGTVIATVAKSGLIYLRHAYTPLAVRVTGGTRYVERWSKRPGFAGIVPGEHVEVTGTAGPGTVTPAVVGELRAFLRDAHAQAVIVGLGTTDGGPVAQWFRDALGPPTRAGGGAEIWTDVAVAESHGA